MLLKTLKRGKKSYSKSYVSKKFRNGRAKNKENKKMKHFLMPNSLILNKPIVSILNIINVKARSIQYIFFLYRQKTSIQLKIHCVVQFSKHRFFLFYEGGTCRFHIFTWSPFFICFSFIFSNVYNMQQKFSHFKIELSQNLYNKEETYCFL